jgi:hypothetical protein
MSPSAKIVMRSMFAGVLLALAACNAVLGIEEAELDDVGQEKAAACSMPLEDPTAECGVAAGDPCDECLARQNASLIATCLTAERGPGELKTCREELVDYRLCVGDNCADENGDCGGCLGGSALGREVARNVAACPDCRRTGRLNSFCEAYCACMAAKCGGAMLPDQCETVCEALPVYSRYCRWHHCEAATSPSSDHCKHAVGKDEVGLDTVCNDSAAPGTVCDRTWDGLACDDHEECCSGVCIGGRCVRED